MKTVSFLSKKIEPLGITTGGLVSFLIGSVSQRLLYLIVVVFIDTLLGVQVSISSEKFKLSTFFKKTLKKAYYYLLFMMLFHAVDGILNTPGTARWLSIFGMLSLEITSVYKHLIQLKQKSLASLAKSIITKLSDLGNNIEVKDEDNQEDEDKA